MKTKNDLDALPPELEKIVASHVVDRELFYFPHEWWDDVEPVWEMKRTSIHIRPKKKGHETAIVTRNKKGEIIRVIIVCGNRIEVNRL